MTHQSLSDCDPPGISTLTIVTKSILRLSTTRFTSPYSVHIGRDSETVSGLLKAFVLSHQPPSE